MLSSLAVAVADGDTACTPGAWPLPPWQPAETALLEQARWPFRDRPFEDVVAWGNLELIRKAVEIGDARFRFAARPDCSA